MNYDTAVWTLARHVPTASHLLDAADFQLNNLNEDDAVERVHSLVEAARRYMVDIQAAVEVLDAGARPAPVREVAS